MCIKRIFLLYLLLTLTVLVYPTVSYPYLDTEPKEVITQYIIDLSRDINYLINSPDIYLLEDSRGELQLRLLLSPWGDLKDIYVSESSGNIELDNLCLRAVKAHDKYQPFPAPLGDRDRWIDVPVIFDSYSGRFDTEVKEDWFTIEKGEYTTLSGIDEAVDIALENNISAKIAEEEISLSNLKIREARRSLFPAASLNYMETTGKTTGNTQDFTDKEYKVKFEYPLYYGWRLKYAVDQAISNMKASKYNYDKVQQDLRMEVESAFYSYVISKINLRLQRSLWQETERIFNTARKRYDIGLSTKAEFLQVESQLKQIKYQVSNSENELTMARLTLAQAMNTKAEDLDGLLGVDIDVDLEPIDIDLSLEECMDLAFKYRPDLKSKEYLIEFNDYEYKIAKAKDQFKVDLTGTYGKSGGAYATESLDLANDWYFGVKVTKPLGANTFSSAYTKDETSEKHGQSTRTESVSKSFELGILDNLEAFSQKKSTSIALGKAREDFEKTKDSIFKEIKESYLGYKKALIQTASSLNKIEYKEEELKIAEARAELNEMPFSELIQSYMNLTDEKLFYIEALGNMYQSLAKLDKATGYALFLDDRDIRVAEVR